MQARDVRHVKERCIGERFGGWTLIDFYILCINMHKRIFCNTTDFVQISRLHMFRNRNVKTQQYERQIKPFRTIHTFYKQPFHYYYYMFKQHIIKMHQMFCRHFNLCSVHEEQLQSDFCALTRESLRVLEAACPLHVSSRVAAQESGRTSLWEVKHSLTQTNKACG